MAAGDVEVNLNNPLGRRCACFDGVDDRIDLGGTGALDILDKISISLWFNIPNVSGTKTLISNRPNTTDYWTLRIINNRVQWVGSNGGSSWDVDTSAYISKGIWYNLILTYENSTKKAIIYSNGVNIKEEITTGVELLHVINSQTILGTIKQSVTAEMFKGYMSDVRVWNKVLSSDEVLKVSRGENVNDKLLHRYKLYTDSTDYKGSADGSDVGVTYQTIDDQVAQAVAADRTTANDKYLICVTNNKVMTTVIEEAP